MILCDGCQNNLQSPISNDPRPTTHRIGCLQCAAFLNTSAPNDNAFPFFVVMSSANTISRYPDIPVRLLEMFSNNSNNKLQCRSILCDERWPPLMFACRHLSAVVTSTNTSSTLDRDHLWCLTSCCLSSSHHS